MDQLEVGFTAELYPGFDQINMTHGLREPMLFCYTRSRSIQLAVETLENMIPRSDLIQFTTLVNLNGAGQAVTLAPVN
jgi:hypothetical protein